LEFKIIQNNQFELLSDRRALAEFEPRRSNAVEAIVEGQRKVGALIY
jgi:hypothetical protein